MESQTSDNASKRAMLAVSPYNQVALPKLPEGRGPIQIFDTTLRDGEQAPGIALSAEEKVRIAAALDDLGVDYIEAGFAVSSDIERKTIREIVDAGPHATVVSLARSVRKDIDAAVETGVPCIHTFIGTSPLHREYKLKMTKEEIVERAVDTVEYARSRGVDVQFSCEDATRTELDYLLEVYKAVVDAGACAINVPDTVGVIVPQGMSYLIGEIGGSAAAHLPLARGVYGEEYDLAAGPEHAGEIGEVALGAGVGVRLEHGEHSAAVLFRGGEGAFEFGGMVSVVKDDLRAPEFACPLAAALNSFERSKSAAGGVQVGAELACESDGECRVLGVVSARKRQS